MRDFSESLNIGQRKLRLHDHLILRLRGRRYVPEIENNIDANSSTTSNHKSSNNTTLDTLNEMTDTLEETVIEDLTNDDDERTKYEENSKYDESIKSNLKNTYNTVPDFSSISKDEEYITLKGIKRNSLSSSSLDIINNRKSFLLKFTERISSALMKFKNFDTGICSDLNIDMSSMVKVLKEESLVGIAQYIIENNCKNIIVMSGAGISTNAEIPDFRSADRGVYANLEKYNIPYPEAIFELEYFKNNPVPFTKFAKSIYPQSIRPTIAHCFIKLLDNHNILLRHYTQNIDGLDYQTRLDSDRIVESHGSFHQSYCVGTIEKDSCGSVYSQSWYKEKLFKGENPILCTKCQGYVKPGVIFFGENLPSHFFKSLHDDIPKCDLLLILGTSLKVYPFAEIIKSVSKKIPRCLINNTLPDIFESELLCDASNAEYIFSDNQYKRDVISINDCDKGCLELAKALGWEEELMKIYENEIEYANKYFN